MTVSFRLHIHPSRRDVLHMKHVARRWLEREAKATVVKWNVSIAEYPRGTGTAELYAWGETEEKGGGDPAPTSPY